MPSEGTSASDNDSAAYQHYFGDTARSVKYEAWAILSETELVSLQPLGADHATLPHMKAMHVPFHLVYGSLISFKGFQSDRPKSRGMSVDPR